jgi:hypothetical protein
MALELGVHSPLIDLFMRGDVPADVKMLAASGHVAPLAVEQLALIAVMTTDADATVARTALDTLAALPVEGVTAMMARADTPEGLRAWLVSQGFVATAPADATPGPLPAFAVERVVFDEASAESSAAAAVAEAATAADDQQARTLSTLSVPARIKMAMLGTREQRAVLVRDPNRVVSSAVLSSPKLSETEVENFSRMTNVAADVLRIIGSNRAWVRNYTVVAALVRNPRTPPALSLGFVPRLQERDLKTLSTDRNVPEALRIAARKALQTKESRRS